MNLDRIRCFIAVVRYGTLTEAAHKLYMAQPNLSRQISLLEEELGYPLFLREHRRMYLTPAGSYLFDAVQHIPEQLDHAVRQAGAIARQQCISLSVGLISGEQLTAQLIEKFRQFQAEHPTCSLQLEREDFDSLRQGLLNGRFDFILTFEFEAKALPETEYEILLRQTTALAISSAHPLARRDTLSLSDLGQMPIVALDARQSALSHQMRSASYEEAGVTPNIVRYVPSSEQLLLAVETGIGAAIVDQNSRIGLSPNVRLYPLPATTHDPNLCIAWRKNTLGTMQQQFLAAIRNT